MKLMWRYWYIRYCGPLIHHSKFIHMHNVTFTFRLILLFRNSLYHIATFHSIWDMWAQQMRTVSILKALKFRYWTALMQCAQEQLSSGFNLTENNERWAGDREIFNALGRQEKIGRGGEQIWDRKTEDIVSCGFSRCSSVLKFLFYHCFQATL